jgi:hypothetical protein
MDGGIETRSRFADAHDLQTVEHAVARILAETDRPVEVYSAVLEAIGGLSAGSSAPSGRPFPATG